MNKSKEIVQIVLPVEKHKGIGIVRTTRVGTWTLALIFVNINPTLAEGTFNTAQVILTQDCQSIFCFFKASW